jgi:hypothetical protein
MRHVDVAAAERVTAARALEAEARDRYERAQHGGDRFPGGAAEAAAG